MGLSYDVLTWSFLSKISEYEFAEMGSQQRTDIVDGYMRRAVAKFRSTCRFDFGEANDETREFSAEIQEDIKEEVADIISDGMVVEWLKPFVNQQDNWQLLLNTRDFTSHSPAELLFRVRGAYDSARKEFTNKMREFSYSHGDLTDLHT